MVSGSGEKEGKDVRAGSVSWVDDAAAADALDPARFGAPLTVRTFLLSDDALDACEEDRLDRLLPLSDITELFSPLLTTTTLPPTESITS